MTKEALQTVLAAHALWLANKGGARADLCNANLRNANLCDANLRNANLRNADLRDADLRNADLRDADLCNANLRNANLCDANLCDADLCNANLRNANLCDADLCNADLRNADLCGAKSIPEIAAARLMACPESGPFEGWKKCSGGVLVRLLIPANARRSSATTRKCRAEFAKVLEVVGAKVGISSHDGKTEYRKGKTVRCDLWEENRWVECGGGIHFFITRQEAENY